MIRKITVTTSMLCLIASTVQAKENEREILSKIDSEFNTCVERAGSQTAAMNNCTGKAGEQYKEQIDIIYKKLMKVLSGEAKESLRKSQAAWENYFKHQSQFIGDFYPLEGTMYSTMRIHDHTTLYKERLEHLLAYLGMHKNI